MSADLNSADREERERRGEERKEEMRREEGYDVDTNEHVQDKMVRKWS